MPYECSTLGRFPYSSSAGITLAEASVRDCSNSRTFGHHHNSKMVAMANLLDHQNGATRTASCLYDVEYEQNIGKRAHRDRADALHLPTAKCEDGIMRTAEEGKQILDLTKYIHDRMTGSSSLCRWSRYSCFSYGQSAHDFSRFNRQQTTAARGA